MFTHVQRERERQTDGQTETETERDDNCKLDTFIHKKRLS